MADLKKEISASRSLWICFFIFASAHALLAYGTAPAEVKGWICLAGLILPAGWLILASKKAVTGQAPVFLKETLPALSGKNYFWIVLFLGAAGLRLFHLTSLYVWPTGDEGLHGFLAIYLIKHWNWQFFYTVGEHPPLLIWSLRFFFEWFKSPFFNLWFLPAFFSWAALLAGYFASRAFFSKSFSLLFGGLLAASFWPLYAGRFCHQGLFVPFWELLSFWLLAGWLKSSKAGSSRWRALALGVWVGLGTFTFTAWAAVWLLGAGTVFLLSLQKKIKSVPFFTAGLLLASLPFAVAAIREGYGHHLVDSSEAGQWFSPSHELVTHLSYLTSLFWGSLQTGGSYGPVWGGILNPVLGACFFLGLLELYQQREKGLVRWIGAGFLICLLPGLLSADYVEFNRMIQAMPFVLLIAAMGIQRLILARWKSGENIRRVVLILLLGLSVILDGIHFLTPAMAGPVFKGQFKKEIPDENFQAYQYLNSLRLERGPGFILAEFLPLKYGNSLFVTTYALNDPETIPALPSGNWLAVAVPRDEKPFLLKRFPGAQWKDWPQTQGDLGLLVLTVREAGKDWARWVQADAFFHQLHFEGENAFNSPRAFRQSLRTFTGGYGLVRGDPFLEALYWDWGAQYDDPTRRWNVMALKNAIQRGYSAPHLYQELGEALSEQKKSQDAPQTLQPGFDPAGKR